jgi:hypothetical protein
MKRPKATDEQKAEFNNEMARCVDQMVKALYLPGATVNYTGDTGKHDQLPISDGGDRQGFVDIAIARLVEALWRLGFDTVGSCERDNLDLSYVQFVSAERGGDWFKALLDRNQVNYKEQTSNLPITIKDFTVSFTAISVWFHVSQLDRVTVAVEGEARRAAKRTT